MHIAGPLDPSWDGPVKVVNDNELESHTASGWVHLASFEERCAEYVSGKEPAMFPKNDSGYHNDSDLVVETSRAIPASTWKHLIGQPKETALQEASEKIEGLEHAVKALGEEMKKGAEEKQVVEKQLAQSQENEKRYMETFEGESSRHQDTRTRMRQMEADLGKLREAIGSVEFDRILKPSE